MNQAVMDDITQLNGLNIEVPDNVFSRLLTLLMPLAEERCMLITGMQSGHQSGAMADVIGALEQLSIAYQHYKILESGASVTSAHLATKTFRKSGASFLIAIGGGSVLSVAKFMASNYENNSVRTPLILIPTSPGCGTLSTRLTVLMDYRCKHCISIICTLRAETVLLNNTYFETLTPAMSIPAFLMGIVNAAEYLLAGGVSLYPECQSVYLRLLVHTYDAWCSGIKPYLQSFTTEHLKKRDFIYALVACAIEMGLLQNRLGIGFLTYLGSAVSYRHGSNIGKSSAMFLAPLLRIREDSLGKEVCQLYESVGVESVDGLGQVIKEICKADGEGLLCSTSDNIDDIVLCIDHVLPTLPYAPLSDFEMRQLLEAGYDNILSSTTHMSTEWSEVAAL
ncbi:Hypothetical protein GLP15_698 [Giardia lamblia P15]|uniref:Alcohol dehydrogenase iron-type/glycerol dehydrogenase GldA domain-containing protein n=1 Tax=Giardia intestinalis (strain P15) TaxID=658858 RepID=E1F429_GIAIA|nr:Hypothetical protein GLP15_698 [Giardia lamblia P15]